MIQTPAYVCEETKLIDNLKILRQVGDESGAKVLCALKGFAFSGAMPLVAQYLDGATSSGLHESKYAKDFKFKLIHTYSPAFKDEEFDEILNLSDHIVFNSFNQWNKFKSKAQKSQKSFGLRVNPQISSSPVDAYNPCSRYSRLGITKANFDFDGIKGIDGLHFHALCEESSEALEIVLKAFEDKFNPAFKNLKWVNFGGGHHITKFGYNKNKLIKLLGDFSQKYALEVFIEPGEAVGWECGYLIATILDIVDNEQKTCIIDVSPECHMPDTVLMPYRPAIKNENKNGKFAYRFGGNSCLAGDIVGLAAGDSIYKFDYELKIGDKIIFQDQIHYTIVKNTTFNGIKLPNLIMQKQNGEFEMIREFGYENFALRN